MQRADATETTARFARTSSQSAEAGLLDDCQARLPEMACRVQCCPSLSGWDRSNSPAPTGAVASHSPHSRLHHVPTRFHAGKTPSKFKLPITHVQRALVDALHTVDCPHRPVRHAHEGDCEPAPASAGCRAPRCSQANSLLPHPASCFREAVPSSSRRKP